MWKEALVYLYRIHTLKILLDTQVFIRIITFHGDGGGPEATTASKVIKTSYSCKFSERIVILKKVFAKSMEDY